MTREMPMQLLRAYIPFEMLVSIKDWVEKKPFKSEAEATRHFIDMGMKMESVRENFQDPVKAEAFMQEMKNTIKNEQIEHWFETLDNSQLEAISFFLNQESDRRSPKQRSLV